MTIPNILLPLWIIVLLAVGYVLHIEAHLFIWLFCSLLLFAVIDPWYLLLRRKGFSSAAAAALLVLAATFISGIFISLFLYISTDAYQELDTYRKILLDYYDALIVQIKDFINNFMPAAPAKTIPKVQVVEASPIPAAMSAAMLSGMGSVMEILVYIFLWPILTFFMLSERDTLARKSKFFFKDDYRAQMVWVKIVSMANAYFFGNLILLIITVPIFISLFLSFSIDNFVTLAILAALINSIPFVGALLTGVLPALQVLAENDRPLLAFWIYILCLTIHFLVANFVTPKLLGARVSLNATTSTIALMVWSLMWGGLGLILAIPMTALIKILLESSRHSQLQWLAELMENPRSSS